MALLEFDLIFGTDSRGTTAEERAMTSKKRFVRSQDHLAEFSSAAKGHVLTAWEVYQNFGIEVLNDVFEHGSAILANSVNEPALSFRKKRKQLNLSVEDVARYAHVTPSEIKKLEDPKARNPIHLVEKVASMLGLDERVISFRPGAGGDERLSARLREVGDETGRFSPNTVLTFHEAAWVIFTEDRLKRWVNSRLTIPSWQKFSPSANYGDAIYPAWHHGYYLAQQTRKILGIGNDDPIQSIRHLFESLDLPLVQAKITGSIAGATLACGDSRGVVINTVGANSNVWVRRITMAHELGHLLWDPDQRLNKVRVDFYNDIESDSRSFTDFVEQRANAFAIEFLAPQAYVREIYKSTNDKSSAIKNIMGSFGISYTSACHHVRNSLGTYSADFVKPEIGAYEPSDEWVGAESFTSDYFPISKTNQLRRGDFAALVVLAEKKGLISENTAAEYLTCELEEYEAARSTILDIYPDIAGREVAV